MGRAPDRLREQSHALGHAVGIAEGSHGPFGRPTSSLDPIQHTTAPHRDTITHQPADSLPPGTVIDPVCGMTVSLNAINLHYAKTNPNSCNECDNEATSGAPAPWAQCSAAPPGGH